MKILMATMGLGIGGAETHIVELSKELSRRGMEVLIASNGGVYVEEIEKAGVRHFSVPMNRRSIPLMIKSYFKLRNIIKEEKPDIVHAHARIPGFLCRLLQKTMKFPFVTTAHWVFSTGGLLRLLTRWGDKTIAVSEDISDYLTENYGIKKEDIFVTINGIDTEKFSPEISGDRIRTEFQIPSDAQVVSHVSRLDESRAIAARELIAGAEDIAKAAPGVVILIAGGGDVYDELYGKAEEVNRRLKRRCVIMAGPRTDINEIAAAGDVFVGVSRAALEAMAAAKVTVVAGNEGYMGIYTEDKLEEAVESNFCCRGCDMIKTDVLVSDVVKCLTIEDDEKKELEEASRRAVMEHYSVGRMAEDAISAYKAALPKTRILMSGYYGYGNAGDEAILEAVYGCIKKIDRDIEVTVLSNDTEKTKAVYGCGAVNRFGLISLGKAIKKCDILISGGGSLLQDMTSTRSLLYYLYIIRRAKKAGKKVMLYANGIGPVHKEKNRRRVKSTVKLADVITVRDIDSKNELISMGIDEGKITVTADPVFSLEPADEGAVKDVLKTSGVPEAPFAVVSVRPWKMVTGFDGIVAEVCDEIYEKYKRNVVFVTMQPDTDIAAAKSIMEKMKSPSYLISRETSIRELMGVIGRADAMLSMRLHSLIFAARMAVPAAGMVYDPKVSSLLRELGLPSAGDTESLSLDTARAAMEYLFENREDIKSKLENRREAMLNGANENEKYLTILIDKFKMN